MTTDDFEALLDSHGGDPARWPNVLRADVEALLRTSRDARASLAAMQDIEAYFARSATPSTQSGMLATRAMRHRQIHAGRRLVTRTGWSAVAATLLLIGFFLGVQGVTHEDDASVALAQALSPMGITDVD